MEKIQNKDLPENSNSKQPLPGGDAGLDIVRNPNDDDSICFESVYQSIRQASAKSTYQRFMKFFGPIFFVVWGFYLVAFAKVVKHIKNQLSVKSKFTDDFQVNGPETIYTASKKAFEGTMPMRFFGIRFLAIWVLPIAITGAVMEFLFVSPLTGNGPFN